MRRYCKNTSIGEVIDRWNNFLFYSLNYSNDTSGTDIKNIFKDAAIDAVSDV
ncbi:hypothetical protein [Flavobacterium sp. B17]|uniref:hypothetical protein n=1 Tax=Flavobacterium sp. B17 TaxID=95618 RepID=UPI00034D23FB|nr:hypothetical protein [Flavobacterium sp. B17]